MLAFLQPSFNLAFELAAVAVHPEHHAEDESGAEEEGEAFVGIGTEVDFGEAPGGDKAGKYGSYEGLVDGGEQGRAAGFFKVSDGDGDDEGGLDSFAKSDDKSLEHIGN